MSPRAQTASSRPPIADPGYQSIALSFANYTQELPFFCDRVLPLLAKAG